jgi:hypothetical protein
MPNKKVPVRNVVSNTKRAGIAGIPDSSYSTSTDGKQPEGWWTQEEARLYETWAATFNRVETQFNNPYFDYFYTGQDISVSIDGLTEPEDKLYIYSFGYAIQQQKQPVYGFWSYTFDGMLRGTRIITGAFSLVVREPHELAKKIAKASHIRALRANTTRGLYPINGLDEDEANIERYWRRNKDYNLEVNQQHLFSIHPPFNMIIQYGLQTTSLQATNPGMRTEDIRNFYKGKVPIHSDYNERLVPNITPELDQRILLENIELTSKSIEYNVDGDPVLENFTFIARDERIVQSKNNARLAPPSTNPSRSRVILS